MPTTIEELEGAIQDTESEANSMLFLNQNVLQEYQNRKREVRQFYKCADECIVASYLPMQNQYVSSGYKNYVVMHPGTRTSP